MSLLSNIQPSGAGDTAQMDEHEMYCDVNIMEIDSNSESQADPAKKNKNKDPMADIDHFFNPVKHLNGDKHRQCQW